MNSATDSPVAVVAGASRGLGLAIARELGRSGHQLVITARDASDLERAREWLEAEGVRATARVHDVRDADRARTLAAEVESEFGPIEVLIVAAGVLQVGPTQADTVHDDPGANDPGANGPATDDGAADGAQQYRKPLDIMLGGPINVVHAVLPGMRRRRRGRIGIVTSIAGFIPVPHLVPYSAAKFGAVGFARGLSEELHGSGITVSTIVPGLMRTGGHWHGDYIGRPTAEYTWFALLSSLPLVSIDAGRAAEIIVRGVLRGRTTVAFPLTTRLAIRVYHAAPNLSTRILGLSGRFLPGPGNDREPGYRAERSVDAHWFEQLTVLGRRAVDRWNQRSAHRADPHDGGDPESD